MTTAVIGPNHRCPRQLSAGGYRWEWWEPDEPEDPFVDPAEFDKPENPELPQPGDAHWDVFIADDDQCDPWPEDGDFWIDDRPEDTARLR